MKDKIRTLLKQKQAILLAHNYQPPEIQDLADLCGDSLELSRKAAQTDAAVIVFCGVHFMAETASMLSPDKTVLLPRRDAGCPMADMITADALAAKKAELGPMPVVTYVNSTAAVKALSTVCCTSANVLDIVAGVDADEMFLAPDRNLARYAASKTDKKIHYWDGYCPVHDRLTPEQVRTAKTAHPDAVFMAHPECRPEVLALADEVASTSGMIRYAAASDRHTFIVGTEIGILHSLNKASPDKRFYPAADTMTCIDMKKISLADIAACLETGQGEVRVPEDIRRPAVKTVERMLALTG